MNRLILETSTSQSSVAFFRGTELMREEVFASGRNVPSRLFSILQSFLQTGEKIDELIVGVGPGSYSGIRIGLSAAIGLRLNLGCQLHGICSALGYPGDSYQVVLDARDQFTWIDVAGGQLLMEPVGIPCEEFATKRVSALSIYSPDLLVVIPVERTWPSASLLGKRVLSEAPSWRRKPVPMYLKAPHITVSKKPLPGLQSL